MRQLFVLILICQSCLLFSQEDVLFSINDKDINVSEFKYIYEKNNGDEADYSKESIEEYLDLYINFKLKVERARELGMDTIKTLNKELAGYRKQLADSYLVDKEVSNRLIDEVIERQKTDRKLSHIFISAPNDAPEKLKIDAERKIYKIYDQLENGADFGSLAREKSEDKMSALKSGVLGFYTAMLPNGFYEFENALYQTDIGSYSKPIQTKLGWHIIKVIEDRPAYGQLEIAHILVKHITEPSSLGKDKEKIDNIHLLLSGGSNFDELAQTLSEDKKTRNRSGYLGFIGLNQYESAFENAAFDLKNDGDFSAPLKTKLGYHIIKRISKKNNENESLLRRQIENKISKDNRYDIAQKMLIEKIKGDANIKQNQSVLNQFTSKIDDEFFNYTWSEPALINQVLFSFNDSIQYSIHDFSGYCKKQTRARLNLKNKKNIKGAVEFLYEQYVGEEALKFEELNLENKYPDFKSLMKEYEEGILLFEATKQEVWDKASQDSIGLSEFYEGNKSNYMWRKRANITNLTLSNCSSKEAKKIHSRFKKYDELKFKSKYASLIASEKIKLSSNTMEDGLSNIPTGLEWNQGSTTDLELQSDGTYISDKVVSIIPATHKKLDEARGYIIADYQDQLEKNWIKSLKEKYTVKLNDKVVQSIIK